MNEVPPAQSDVIKEAIKSQERAQKRSVVENFQLDSRYSEATAAIERKEAIEAFDPATVDSGSLKEELDKEHAELIEVTKNQLPFINDYLSSITPFYYGNLVLVGAMTGHGKSTTSANLTESLIGANKRVLVITNEEIAIDVYNRIACLRLNYNYAEFKNFTDEQHLALMKIRAELLPLVRVIDNNTGPKNLTTNIEGIRHILESCIRTTEKTGTMPYDAILIDYYQNVGFSLKNPNKEKHKVLADLSNFLDDFRRRYKGPVVVFIQLHPSAKSKDQVSFESRIKEGKSICMKATISWEVVPYYEEKCSEWKLHKKRNRTGTEPEKIVTPFRKGRYCDPDWQLIMDETGTLIQPDNEETKSS